MWASLQDAYDRLSEPLRDLCDRLIAIHHDPWFAADVDERGGYQWDGEQRDKLLPAIHPVVRTHPENGRNGLFVNAQFTQLIIGLSKHESNALLDMLYRHCVNPSSPAASAGSRLCRVLGQPGLPALRPRRLRRSRRFGHRVTLRGDRPFGPAMPRPARLPRPAPPLLPPPGWRPKSGSRPSPSSAPTSTTRW